MKSREKFFRSTIPLVVLFWAVSAALPIAAGDLVVTRYFSGLWDQPKQESQGIILQIIDQEEDGKPKAVAYWFTYGDDLGTTWYVAIGHVEGNQVLTTLYTAYGVSFMEDDSPELTPVETVGELILTFGNCNHGVASYSLEEGGEATSGEFEVKRLAALYNSRCTGGISDDTPSDAKPVKLEVELDPPLESGDGEGMARFWERSDRSDLHISVGGIPDDLYSVRYCTADYPDVLEVTGGEGSVKFRSPEVEGILHLILSPRDCLIEVYKGGDVFLTSGENFLGEKGKGDDEDENEAGTEVKVEMTNVSAGMYPEAAGELKYEVEGDYAEFKVEIEDAPAGVYGFWVDGNLEGQFEVNEQGTGKLRFSDPQEGGALMLNFAPPWDKIMEVCGPAAPDGPCILEAHFSPSP
jgi:hypothetical protein